MDALLIAKPDIAFAIDQFFGHVRIRVKSFRITERCIVKSLGQPLTCSQAKDDGGPEGQNPDALGSINNLSGPFLSTG